MAASADHITTLGDCGEYAERTTVRKERQNLLKAKNVYPVPTARLLAAIAHALQQVSPEDTGHGPRGRKDG